MSVEMLKDFFEANQGRKVPYPEIKNKTGIESSALSSLISYLCKTGEIINNGFIHRNKNNGANVYSYSFVKKIDRTTYTEKARNVINNYNGDFIYNDLINDVHCVKSTLRGYVRRLVKNKYLSENKKNVPYIYCRLRKIGKIEKPVVKKDYHYLFAFGGNPEALNDK